VILNGDKKRIKIIYVTFLEEERRINEKKLSKKPENQHLRMNLFLFCRETKKLRAGAFHLNTLYFSINKLSSFHVLLFTKYFSSES